MKVLLSWIIALCISGGILLLAVAGAMQFDHQLYQGAALGYYLAHHHKLCIWILDKIDRKLGLKDVPAQT